jgi:putative endonuclease
MQCSQVGSLAQVVEQLILNQRVAVPKLRDESCAAHQFHRMYLYILKSVSTGKFYVGSTEDIDARLSQHNAPRTNPSRWTRCSGPWELEYLKEFSEKRSAIRAERYVKSMKSREFLKKLITGEYSLSEFDT